jgi:hypothetical protein
MELSSHLTEDGGAKTGGGYGNETPQRDRDDASVGAGGENGTEGAAGEADAKGGEPTAVPGTVINLRSIVCCCTIASNFFGCVYIALLTSLRLLPSVSVHRRLQTMRTASAHDSSALRYDPDYERNNDDADSKLATPVPHAHRDGEAKSAFQRYACRRCTLTCCAPDGSPLQGTVVHCLSSLSVHLANCPRGANAPGFHLRCVPKFSHWCFCFRLNRPVVHHR